jgi:hypothetical protein
MKNKTHLFVVEKITKKYRDGQIDFANKILDVDETDLKVTGDLQMSMETLIDKCKEGDYIFIVETKWITNRSKPTNYEKIFKFGDSCSRKNISIQILNPLSDIDYRFNFKYNGYKVRVRQGVSNGKSIDYGLYDYDQGDTWQTKGVTSEK